MDNFWSSANSNIKKEKSEFEEKFTDVKKENIALISQNEIFDHWFKLFSWKFSSSLENTIPPCDSGLHKKIKKCQPHPF